MKRVNLMNDIRDKGQSSFPVGTGRILAAFVFLLILVSLLFTAACQKSAPQLPVLYNETDWQRMGVHGNVNGLTLYELSWEEAFGRIKVTSAAIVDQSTVFAETGNQVESVYYSLNGQPKWKDTFLYDITGEYWMECISYRYTGGDGNAVLPQWSYNHLYDGYSRVYRVEGYDYDEAGQKLSPASWMHTYEYLYDDGQIVRSSYDSRGALQWKNVTQYDTNARATKSTHYDHDGVMQWSDKYVYDAKGNRTEWSRYDSKGALQWRDVFKFDDNGNEIECSNYDYRNRLMWKDIYIYITEGELENFDINKGRDVENKFDRYGNWTIKMTLEEKEGFGSSFLSVKEIQKRSITYFP